MIKWVLFTLFECLILGLTIYITTVFTLRAWHCYKNEKVDPVHALRKRDISAARAEKLKQATQDLMSMG